MSSSCKLLKSKLAYFKNFSISSFPSDGKTPYIYTYNPSAHPNGFLLIKTY